jgi:hypothetical protein
MSVGAAPIDPDEPILRRIPINPGYYSPTKAPPVERGAFVPRPIDVDGLSFYLEREISPAELVAAVQNARCRFVVARMRASDIYGLGLSLVTTMEPGDLPGHMIVPEINFATYHDRAQRQRMKEWGAALAEIASRNIVFESPPTEP